MNFYNIGISSMKLTEYVKQNIKEKLYPFTLKHLFYFTIITIINTIILNYFLNFRLFKWIYVGTSIVIIATTVKSLELSFE